MRLVEDAYTGPRAATLGCPSPDVLIALGGDALPEELRQPAEAHLKTCAACRALVADLDALDIVVPASLDARVLSREGARGASWRGPLLALAAVIVAAVALGVVYRKRPDEGAQVARVEVPAAATPVVPKGGTWAVSKPALLLPLATALVVRGEAEEASRALGAALAPYRTDDYVEAERLLEAVVEKYPASADAWFYWARHACSTAIPPAPAMRSPRPGHAALATATTKPLGCWRPLKRGWANSIWPGPNCPPFVKAPGHSSPPPATHVTV